MFSSAWYKLTAFSFVLKCITCFGLVTWIEQHGSTRPVSPRRQIIRGSRCARRESFVDVASFEETHRPVTQIYFSDRPAHWLLSRGGGQGRRGAEWVIWGPVGNVSAKYRISEGVKMNSLHADKLLKILKYPLNFKYFYMLWKSKKGMKYIKTVELYPNLFRVSNKKLFVYKLSQLSHQASGQDLRIANAQWTATLSGFFVSYLAYQLRSSRTLGFYFMCPKTTQNTFWSSNKVSFKRLYYL